MNPGRKKAQFRPCIDLHDGKVKQIVGSTLSDSESTVKTNFVIVYFGFLSDCHFNFGTVFDYK